MPVALRCASRPCCIGCWTSLDVRTLRACRSSPGPCRARRDDEPVLARAQRRDARANGLPFRLRLARAGGDSSTNENMKPRILQSARLMSEARSPPSQRTKWKPIRCGTSRIRPHSSEVRGGEFEILVTNATAGASASMMDARLAFEGDLQSRVGCDAIDLQAARERGVVVANTPDVLH